MLEVAYGRRIASTDNFLKATHKRSQKTFHISSGNDRGYPIFCGQYSIDTQERTSYTPTLKKQCLINSINSIGGFNPWVYVMVNRF
jgi:hypothetical protein